MHCRILAYHQNVSQYLGPWMVVYRCRTVKDCHTLSIVAYGVGLIYNRITSWNQWITAIIHFRPSKRMSASIHITIDVSSRQVRFSLFYFFHYYLTCVRLLITFIVLSIVLPPVLVPRYSDFPNNNNNNPMPMGNGIATNFRAVCTFFSTCARPSDVSPPLNTYCFDYSFRIRQTACQAMSLTTAIMKHFAIHLVLWCHLPHPIL